MQALNVWLRLPNGDRIQVGELISSEPDIKRGGRLQGEFRYHEHYLSQDSAFALDPIHLPLQAGIFRANRPHSGVHGVFEDSLPDDWGRRALVQRYQIPRHQQHVPNLLSYLSIESLGALAYVSRKCWPSDEEDSVAKLPDLEQLIFAAERFERHEACEEADQYMRQLFKAASSPGGARPKLLLQHQGAQWIAKLPSSKDHLDIVSIEAATLDLAIKAGLQVPSFFVENLTSIKRRVLLLARFDVTQQHGRYHMISLQSLLGADGFYNIGYVDVVNVIRQVSDQPEVDVAKFYRQMLFNAMIANTDDHLKNFSMYHTAQGWQLTPAYDLLPDIEHRREHILHFGYHGLIPSQNALLSLGKSFGLTKHVINMIYDEVKTAIEQWRDSFAAYHVPEHDIEILSKRMRHY